MISLSYCSFQPVFSIIPELLLIFLHSAIIKTIVNIYSKQVHFGSGTLSNVIRRYIKIDMVLYLFLEDSNLYLCAEYLHGYNDA